MRLLLWIAVLLTGCAPKHMETAWVGEIHVRGLAPTGRDLSGNPDLAPLRATDRDTAYQGRRTAIAARRLILHHNAHWWQYIPAGTLIERRPHLDAIQLDADGERLRSWLGDQGWSDATVTWGEERANEWWLYNKKHTRYTDVTYTVDLGVREVLAEVSVDGLDGLPDRLQDRLRARVPKVGAASSPRRRDDVTGTLQTLLEDANQPLARVSVDVSGPVDARVERYHVVLAATPPIGRVTIRGTDYLSHKMLDRVVSRASHPGKPWTGARLDRIAQQLGAHPDLHAAYASAADALDPDGTLPWTLHVEEEPRNSRHFSTAISPSGALLALGFGVYWSHHGIGHHLATLSGYNRVGYRYFDGPPGEFFTGAEHGPATEHRVDLEGAPFPIARVSAFLAGSGALDSYRGYVQVRGFGEAGIRWRPLPALTLGAFYRGGYAYHYAWPWHVDAFERGFSARSAGGLGLAKQHDLHAFVLRLDYDTTNHARLSTKGVKLEIEGVPFGLASKNPWHRLSADMIWYANVLPERLVLVTHLGLGLNGTNDDGEQDGILVNRFFLGGPRSMRGFGFHRLGPPGSPGIQGQVLPGGDAMLYGSLELRYRLHPDLFAGTFFDVGRTWDAVRDRTVGTAVVQRGIHLADLQPVAGFGGIGRTPIGGLEAWLGFQLLRDTKLDGEPPGVAVQFVLTAGW